MTTPFELFWQTAGDLFRDKIFTGVDRRPIEGLWQSQQDLAADALAYARYLKQVRSLYEAPAYAPGGRQPLEADPIQTTGQIPARLLDVKKDTDWVWLFWTPSQTAIPQEGYLSFGDYSLKFTSSTTINLLSGGRLVKLGGTPTESVPPEVEPLVGEAFDVQTPLGGQRWDQDSGRTIAPQDQGFFFDVRGSDWVLLQDQFYMNGSTSWQLTYRFEVTQWDGFPGGHRHISVQSMGDVGVDFEVTLRQKDPGGLVAEIGEKGGTHQKTTAIPVDWLDRLESADPTSPVPVEFELSYQSSANQMTASIYLGDGVVDLTQPVSVSPGRRSHSFGVYNSHNTVAGHLSHVTSKKGERWGEDVSPEGTISQMFPHEYGIREDIVAADLVRQAPWDFAPPASVVDRTEEGVSVKVDEGWQGYAPSFVRVSLDEGWLQLERTTHDGRSADYRVARQSKTGLEVPDRLRLHPWHMTPQEVSFPQPGRMHTQFPLTDERWWGEGCLLEEVDLYGRFGRLLGAPRRPDSDRYLQLLRGVDLAVRRRPTPQNLTQALNVFLGLPYLNEGGVVDEVRPGESFDEVEVQSEVYEVPSYWRQKGLLKEEGTRIQDQGTLAEGVTVTDWKTGQLPDYIDEWAKWGTFLVKIPGVVGLSGQDVDLMHRMLKAAKKQTTDYRIEFEATIDEDQRSALSEQHVATQGVHQTEDLTFSDGPSLVLHPAISYGADHQRQQDEDILLEDKDMLDAGNILGSRTLHKGRARLRDVGASAMGEGYETRSLPGPELVYEGVDLKAPLTGSEQDIHLQRPGLRMSPVAGDDETGTARVRQPTFPSDIMRLYHEGATDKEPAVLFLIDGSSEAASQDAVVTGALDNFVDQHADDIRAKVVVYQNGGTSQLLAYGQHSAADLKAAWSSITYAGDRPLEEGLREVFATDFYFQDDPREHIVLATVAGGASFPGDPAEAVSSLRLAYTYVYTRGAGAGTNTLPGTTSTNATTVGDLEVDLNDALEADRQRRATPREYVWGGDGGPSGGPWYGIDLVAYDDVTICGAAGAAYNSSDYTDSWTAVTTNTSVDLHDTQRGWFVGDNDTIIQSGSTVNASPSQTWDYRSIDWWSSDVGSVVGRNNTDGAILYTTNGGLSWSEDIAGAPLEDHTQTATDVVWAAGDDGVYRWEGGWSQSQATNEPLLGITARSGVVVAVGQQGTIWRREDGAWSKIDFPNALDIQDVAFVDDHRVILVASNLSGTSDIYSSYDRGKTWELTQSTGDQSMHAIGTAFPWYRVAVGSRLAPWQAL